MTNMFRPSLFFRLRKLVGARTNIARPAQKFVPGIHDDTENGFAFNVMRSGNHYKLPLAEDFVKGRSKRDRLEVDDVAQGNLADVKWADISVNHLCSTFIATTLEARDNGCPISDPKYNEMCAWIAKRCPEMTDAQLKELLSAFALWPPSCSPYEPNNMAVWRSIDSVMLSRLHDYKAEKALELMNLWYQASLIKKSDFVYRAVNKMSKKPGRLMPHQLVLLLFYQNLLRKLSKNLKFFPIEERLAEVVDSLSIEEIGVACMGFFKTQNAINLQTLADSIVNKLMKEANTVPEITLASIMKALRYKLPIPLWDRLPSLMDTLQPQIDRMSITGSVHVPLMLTASQTLHKGILDTVAEKLIQNISSARLKDLERVLLPLVLMNYTPKTSKSVFDEVVDQLSSPEREEEFKTWPKSLVSIVQYLAIRGHYVDRLIDRVLDISFLRATYGKTNFHIGREILVIDSCVELDHPNYSGHRLPADVKNYLSKRYSAFIPDPERKMSNHMRFQYDVMQSLGRLTNSKFASKYLLPNHPHADHVVRIGVDGNFAPLPEDFVKIENFTGTIRSPGDDYFAVVPISRNAFLRDSEEVNGETLLKLRQLKIVGYRPVKVIDKTWPLEGTDAEKDRHLLETIKRCEPLS